MLIRMIQQRQVNGGEEREKGLGPRLTLHGRSPVAEETHLPFQWEEEGEGVENWVVARGQLFLETSICSVKHKARSSAKRGGEEGLGRR